MLLCSCFHNVKGSRSDGKPIQQLHRQVRGLLYTNLIRLDRKLHTQRSGAVGSAATYDRVRFCFHFLVSNIFQKAKDSWRTKVFKSSDSKKLYLENVQILISKISFQI
jgi:hypothetical protein